MRLLPLICCCLLIALPAVASITETVSYKHYSAEQQPGMSLLQALDRATPIREGGKVFHAYTAWNIQWRYRWNQEPNGRCTLTQNSSTLTALITLPQLKVAEPKVSLEFSRYIEPLQRHEQGHVDLARAAAQKIDAGIMALPSMDSCALLEQSANRLGQQLVEQARQSGRDYDLKTEHGRTQGAWLPR